MFRSRSARDFLYSIQTSAMSVRGGALAMNAPNPLGLPIRPEGLVRQAARIAGGLARGPAAIRRRSAGSALVNYRSLRTGFVRPIFAGADFFSRSVARTCF